MIKNRLKEIRMREYMMEPAEFAALINVNIKTYYPLELGYSNPSIKKCLEIAKSLNKKVDDIWYLE